MEHQRFAHVDKAHAINEGYEVYVWQRVYNNLSRLGSVLKIDEFSYVEVDEFINCLKRKGRTHVYILLKHQIDSSNSSVIAEYRLRRIDLSRIHFNEKDQPFHVVGVYLNHHQADANFQLAASRLKTYLELTRDSRLYH